MAFSGYLLTIKGVSQQYGDYNLPTTYINEKTYKVNLNAQDLESYRDAMGVLHRNALTHEPLKIEFTTRDNVTNTDLGVLMNAIKNRYTNAVERKLSVTAYIPESDSYVTQDVYMPVLEPTIKYIKGTKIFYEPIRFAWIGY